LIQSWFECKVIDQTNAIQYLFWGIFNQFNPPDNPSLSLEISGETEFLSSLYTSPASAIRAQFSQKGFTLTSSQI